MSEKSEAKRTLLRHFLAALAYRTQKALRGAPASFASFDAGNQARAPKELVRHMRGVLGYAQTFFVGGTYRAEPLDSMEAEIAQLHTMLAQLDRHLFKGTPLRGITEEQLLQGPVRRQLFRWVDDNYFSASTTITFGLLGRREAPASGRRAKPARRPCFLS